ncbi:hypothetical protein GU926_02950 [Nibribacter ruber]|uniref:Porin n=1 Tax=Nibribacter ruber TaxID=2698458 RepID=A0A6P1NZQ1_9BACT|nr:putative porin [Nibribacter ruber]QHL86453.1 hypothetical protein GU926_02950 [Nibribacter ruber]
MTYKKICIAASLLWASAALNHAQAQIIDDSTKAIYGSATTRVLYEAQIFKGNYASAPIDTSLTNLHSTRHWYYDSTLQQNLGNVGTASQPLFWRMPLTLGTRPGRNAFDVYAVRPDQIEYYDTKSPFTFLHYLQGSKGEQIFRAKHTRNVNSRWNVGLGLERLGATRQIGNPRNLDLIEHYGLQAFTHYFSKNDRYHIMANYALTSHEQIESGGIQPVAGETEAELFDYQNEPVWLTNAFSKEDRHTLHATQWYKLISPGLQLYHTLDGFSQETRFADENLPYSGDSNPRMLLFYPRTILDANKTLDNTLYRQLENTFGVMGSTRFFVYRAYVKRRDGQYEITSRNAIGSDPVTYQEGGLTLDVADNFIGGEAQFKLKNDIYVTTDGELQIGGDDYRLTAQARFKWLTLSQTRTSYSPTLLQRVHYSNHFEWFNSFENTTADQSMAQLEASAFNNYLRAQVKYTILNNHVYFQDSTSNHQAEPAQTSGTNFLLQANVQHKFTWKALVLDNTVYYNSINGPKVIRMPEWYWTGRLYAQGPMFKNAITVQAGVEANWHSGYYADAYMPVTQQYYLQNEFKITQYPVLDLFLNADIKTVNLFLKLSNLNAVSSSWEPGYFTTPIYSANPFSFIFGVRWNFYD